MYIKQDKKKVKEAIKLMEKGVKSREACKSVGISYHSLSILCSKNKDLKERHQKVIKEEYEKMKNYVRENGVSLKQVSEDFGVDLNLFSRYLKKTMGKDGYEELKQCKYSHRRQKVKEAIELMIEYELNTSEVSELVNVSQPSLSKWATMFNLKGKMDKISNTNKFKKHMKVLETIEKTGCSINNACLKNNISRQSFAYFIEKNNLQDELDEIKRNTMKLRKVIKKKKFTKEDIYTLGIKLSDKYNNIWYDDLLNEIVKLNLGGNMKLWCDLLECENFKIVGRRI